MTKFTSEVSRYQPSNGKWCSSVCVKGKSNPLLQWAAEWGMRRFLTEKCVFTGRLVNNLFAQAYYRRAQPPERWNTSLLYALIYQLRKGSEAARRKSTFVFSFNVRSWFCCLYSLFLEPLRPRTFSSPFSYLPPFADHPGSLTLIHSQVPPADAAIVVSYWKRKKKAKYPTSQTGYPQYFTYRGCLSHRSIVSSPAVSYPQRAFHRSLLLKAVHLSK